MNDFFKVVCMIVLFQAFLTLGMLILAVTCIAALGLFMGAS